MRWDTIKLLEESIGRTLSDINCSNIFFYLFPRIMEMKTKINKWDLLKLKRFCTAKETINKTKRQPTNCEKIFAKDVANNGIVFKIYKQLMMLNSIKTNNPLRKWAEELHSHFFKDLHMANRHMKRCSPLLIIREIQLKTTMKYHLTPARIASIKKIHKEYMLERMWSEGNPPTLLVGMQIGTATMENSMEVPSRTKK